LNILELEGNPFLGQFKGLEMMPTRDVLKLMKKMLTNKRSILRYG
jgi:hypothetical protein